MTELARLARGEPVCDGSDRTADADRGAVAVRVRERGERVRRRELDTALDRLAVRGGLSAAQRRVLTRLSVRLADALVEQWVAALDEEGVDPDAALALLADPESGEHVRRGE